MAEIHSDDVPLSDGSYVRIELAETTEVLLLRAVDDTGHDVGTAKFDLTPSEHPRSFTIDVAEAARDRGIGRALFNRLLEAASEHEIDWLTFTGPADDALLRMAATSGAVCARRVKGDLAKAVVLVPERRAA